MAEAAGPGQCYGWPLIAWTMAAGIMTEDPRRIMALEALCQRVREILMAEWDPIGCGVPDDEYDSYIPGVCRLLQQGADQRKMSDHLYQLETNSMGLRADKARCERVAMLLIALTVAPPPS